MLAFSRITSILFFVLSLSFFAYAAPTPAYELSAVAPSHPGDQVVSLVAGLGLKVEGHAAALAKVKTVVEVTAIADVLVADVTACAKAVLAVGTKIDIDAAVKAAIAVKIAAIITVIVQACVALVAKFGILALLTVFAKIDICLNLLLTNFGVCIDGIIKLVAEIVVKLGVSVFAQVHLGLCIHLLGLVRLSF